MNLLSAIQSSRNKGSLWTAATVLLAMSFVMSQGATRYRRIVEATLFSDDSLEIQEDANSLTGYESGVRNMLLPDEGLDGMQWITHAQTMVEKGEWRTRATSIDNAPKGREVHWSQGFLWWLITLGKLQSSLTAMPLSKSIELMALFSAPIAFLILLITVPFLTFPRFGSVPSILLVLALVNSVGFAGSFLLAVPDHHGIAAGAIFYCALLLLLAMCGSELPSTSVSHQACSPFFTPRMSDKKARWYFLASGIAGAVGLWISAATAIPVLVGMGAGALMAAIYSRTANTDKRSRDSTPELWRIWGMAGGISSLAFYALEYFPYHMGWRLEVNHPSYGFAWVAAGEVLMLATDWIGNRVNPFRTSIKRFRLAASTLCLSIPPVFIACFSKDCFWISDPFLWRLHQDYILEFASFAKCLQLNMQLFLIWNALIIGFPIVCAMLTIVRANIGPQWKKTLVFLIVPAVFMVGLGLYQIRWLVLAEALGIPVLLVSVTAHLNRSGPVRYSVFEKFIFGFGVVITFSVVPIFAIENQLVQFRKTTIPRSLASSNYLRQIAHKLKHDHPNEDIVVLSGPTDSSQLAYYGGFQCVGTLYWENLEGLKSAAEAFSATTEEQLKKLIQLRGITHIVIMDNQTYVHDYVRLWRNLPEASIPNDTLVISMLNDHEYPIWIKPIYIPPEAIYGETKTTVLEIDFRQSEIASLFHTAAFLNQSNHHVQSSRKYRSLLDKDPSSKDAWIGLGTAMIACHQSAEGWEAIEKGLAGADRVEIARRCRESADFCFNRGFHSDCAKLLDRILQSDPENASTKNTLARVLAISFDETIRDPQRALKLAASNAGLGDKAAYYQTLASAHAANGDYEEAVRNIDRAIEIHQQTGALSYGNSFFEERNLYQNAKPYRLTPAADR
jgi:tetratricopeptide (TPR) repeat protein